jgi:hypothetical protein
MGRLKISKEFASLKGLPKFFDLHNFFHKRSKCLNPVRRERGERREERGERREERGERREERGERREERGERREERGERRGGKEYLDNRSKEQPPFSN